MKQPLPVKLLIFVCCFSIFTRLCGQVHYPIRTYTTVNPPAPWSLDGFVSIPGKLNLQVVVDDISLQEHPVKLQVSINGNGIHIYTRPDYSPEPLYLDGGLTETLTGDDLGGLLNPQNLVFEGYSKNQYRQSGRLPEGVYRISFEVVDYRRNVVLSQSFPAIVLMYLTQAPRLLAPRNAEEVSPVITPALRFSWIMQGITNPLADIYYTFKLWEIRPEGRAAQEIVRSTRPLYQSETAQKWLLYDATLPALETGREYAWQVEAVDRENQILFKNDGKSDVSTFSYGQKCSMPSPYITGVTTTSAGLRWNYDPAVNLYRIFLKEKGDDEWTQTETSSAGYTLEHLTDYTLYQVKVQSLCTDCESEASDPLEFRTNRDVDYTCGSGSKGSFDLSNTNPLPELRRFDTFKAADFLVEVESVKGSNGWFSGTGLVLVPYLNFVKFRVRFDNIFINTDNRMTKGKVVFVYDEATGLILGDPGSEEDAIQIPDYQPVDVAEALAKSTDRQVRVEGKVEDITATKDKVTITTTDGKKKIIPTSGGETVGISPSGGSQAYVADTSTGRVYSFPEQQSGTPGDVHSPAQSGVYGGKVSFSASGNQRYGLDIPGDGKGKPDTYFDRDKSSNLIAWKSLEAGTTDYVNMQTAGNLEADSLRYIRDNGFPVPTAPISDSRTGRSLLLTGGMDGDREMLSVALSTRKSDSTEVLTEVGALGLATYGREDKYVQLIKVRGALCPDNTAPIEEFLNQVYAPAVVKWHVSTGHSITKAELPDLDFEDFRTGNVGMLSRYTGVMKRVYKYYKRTYGTDKNTQYLFFIDYPNADKKGFMPLTGQYGFIFNFGVNFETIAHELGHGTFNLRHTFSEEGTYRLTKGSTDNLMDYGSPQGTELWKPDWDAIHDPEEILFSWTEAEEEGAMMSDYLVLKIEELAKSLGLNLGENAFVTVHSFRCSNVGDLKGASPLDVSGYSNPEFSKYKPQRIIIANSENEGNSDVVNIAILFRINDNEVESEDKSSTGIVLPGMEPPFLGLLQKSGELVECPNQLSMLDEFGCVDDNSLVAQFAEEDYKGLYISKVLTAIHECLEEQEIDNSDGKVGDLFYAEYLKDAESEEEINQLKQVADLFNRIGDVLFSSNNATTWQEYGDFFRASYDAHKWAEQEKPFSDYLSRLEGLISDYEHRKELLEKFEDREKVAILVNTFSDAELEFLPMDSRAHSLNVLSSKELRGALRLSGHNEEELILRLLRFIKSEEISSLIDELKKGDLLNTIDKGFNDLIILVDDNYAGLLDVIDDYILQTKGITNGEEKTEKLVELHEQNRFYNLTDDQEGKKYISAAKVLSEGKVSLTISTITGYDIVYEKQADGPSVPDIRPTIQSETIELPFDEPVALYHNAYLDGVDAPKRGKIELASALKLHYYLQCNKNENIKTTASVIIDVGSLALGVGAISGGIKGVRLVLAICDVASSTVSLLSTGSEKYLIDKYGVDGQAYVNSMQMISAVLGFVDLGATGVGKLKNLLKDDVVTAGAFYAKHGAELANDAQTAELATQTKKIVDEFSDYDDEIARLIDNAGSGVPELFWVRLTDGDKIKLQKYVDNGLDQERLAASYLDASNKVDFIEELEDAQSVFHQRALINDRVDEIPGVSNKPFVQNHLPKKIVASPRILNGMKIKEAGLDLPAIEAEKFISAKLVELPENTVIYRVLGPNSYATGGYWTRTKPSSYADIIGGTAVKPSWNGFTEIIEYKVPPGKKVYVWEGPTAPQALVDEGEPFYDLYKNKYSLEGGTDQIYMPEKYRDYKDPVVSSEFNSRIINREEIKWKKKK